MNESELLEQGYSMDRTNTTERWSKEIHIECNIDKRDGYNKFYYVYWIRLLSRSDDEYTVLNIFEMGDRESPHEGDYLYDIGWCPYCGARLEV